MSAPPYELLYSDEALAVLKDLEENPRNKIKFKKVKKALRQLRDAGPSYPGLETHKMQVLEGPKGEPLWNSYVENHTPAAWRLLWVYGEADQITIVSIGPHPD